MKAGKRTTLLPPISESSRAAIREFSAEHQTQDSPEFRIVARQWALEDADASTGNAAKGGSDAGVFGFGGGDATRAAADGMRLKGTQLSELSSLAVQQYRASLLAPRNVAAGAASAHASNRPGQDAEGSAPTGLSALTLAAIREAKSFKY